MVAEPGDGEVGGERVRFGAGFFRFLPDGSKLDFLRSTNNNSWGFGFSEEGLVFGSTANGNPSEHMPLANRVSSSPTRSWRPAAAPARSCERATNRYRKASMRSNP